MNEPVGIILFNLGGPGTLDEVEPFLVSLFSDREIIELPFGAALQPAFARLIAMMRGPSVRRNYSWIGGGSPQLRITQAQAAALEGRLNRGSASVGKSQPDPQSRSASQPGFVVQVAMRYSNPTADDALAAMEAAGIRRLVTLTLFPHWSQATTGSSERAFQQSLARPRWRKIGFAHTHIASYAADPGYLDVFAGTVRAALDQFSPAARERTVILFSAHGLPQRFIDRGDPYVDQIRATRDGLLARLQVPNRHVLAYQSRTGPVRWIGPGTDETLVELGREGVREVLVVPLSFVSDHIETLYEVDILFADTARRAGIVEYRRPDALNTNQGFIEALARLVEAHLQREAQGKAPPWDVPREIVVGVS